MTGICFRAAAAGSKRPCVRSEEDAQASPRRLHAPCVLQGVLRVGMQLVRHSFVGEVMIYYGGLLSPMVWGPKVYRAFSFCRPHNTQSQLTQSQTQIVKVISGGNTPIFHSTDHPTIAYSV